MPRVESAILAGKERRDGPEEEATGRSRSRPNRRADDCSRGVRFKQRSFEMASRIDWN